MTADITIGVLAIQGAFIEHIEHLKLAVKTLCQKNDKTGNSLFDSLESSISIIEVRTKEQLAQCNGLVIPGGESTAISLVAARTNMLEPLREFVHNPNKAVWGTCAGLILIANQATGGKKAGQQLFGGLDIRVNRNHFGSQLDSFAAELELPVLEDLKNITQNQELLYKGNGFECVFIRAPVVEATNISSLQPSVYLKPLDSESSNLATAPIPTGWEEVQKQNKVQVLASLPAHLSKTNQELCVAVLQGRILGTSFHPELTKDPRLHMWWIKNCVLQL